MYVQTGSVVVVQLVHLGMEQAVKAIQNGTVVQEQVKNLNLIY
jgi:hypothetical protein